MSVKIRTSRPRLRYHPQAYLFVTDALGVAQDALGRMRGADDDEQAHITGAELLDGVRILALRQYGMMAASVLAYWGIHATGDVGRIVFEMIERGELRKTDRDQFSDFVDVYDFDEVFHRDYRVDTSKAFES